MTLLLSWHGQPGGLLGSGRTPRSRTSVQGSVLGDEILRGETPPAGATEVSDRAPLGARARASAKPERPIHLARASLHCAAFGRAAPCARGRTELISTSRCPIRVDCTCDPLKRSLSLITSYIADRRYSCGGKAPGWPPAGSPSGDAGHHSASSGSWVSSTASSSTDSTSSGSTSSLCSSGSSPTQ